MANVLIIAPEADLHARLVAERLLDKGHEPAIFDLADFPERAAFAYGAPAEGKLALPSGQKLGLDWAHSVWLRRPRSPRLQASEFHQDDRSALAADVNLTADWLLQVLAPSARWVNPFGAHLRASNRMTQLNAAASCGLQCPATLFSNDPARITAFLDAYPAVSKPIARVGESAPGLRRMTERLTPELLPAPRLLQKQPLFLQQEVAKAGEIRVHVFGSEITAARLIPRGAAPERVDWNLDREFFDIEQVSLPDKINVACSEIVARLGLLFGIIDLLIDQHDSLFFLELNQMGQFIWLEQAEPALPLTEQFIELLIGAHF